MNYTTMSMPEKMLFIETFLMGDLLYLGALLSAVRARHPDARLEVLTSSATRGFPFFQRIDVTVHQFDFPWSHLGWHSRPFRLAKSIAEFRRQFERRFRDYTVFDPRGDLRHALTARLLHPRRFIQYRSGAQLHDAWRGTSPRHTFISRQEFLRQIAPECGLSSESVLSWPWLADFRPDGTNNMSRNILLAPEASNRLKYWKPENWKLLSKRLQQSGYHVTLIVYRGDAVPDAKSMDFDDIWQGPVLELTRLIGEARAVIAVDSFVGHLAAAVGMPVVSLFGPQLPERWRPWGNHTAVVMAQGYPCRPCGQKRCGRPMANCMDAIQVEQVMQVFNSLIAGETNTKGVPHEHKTS